MEMEAAKLLGAGLAIGAGAIGPGIGIGLLTLGALQTKKSTDSINAGTDFNLGSSGLRGGYLTA